MSHRNHLSSAGVLNQFMRLFGRLGGSLEKNQFQIPCGMGCVRNQIKLVNTQVSTKSMVMIRMVAVTTELVVAVPTPSAPPLQRNP